MDFPGASIYYSCLWKDVRMRWYLQMSWMSCLCSISVCLQKVLLHHPSSSQYLYLSPVIMKVKKKIKCLLLRKFAQEWVNEYQRVIPLHAFEWDPAPYSHKKRLLFPILCLCILLLSNQQSLCKIWWLSNCFLLWASQALLHRLLKWLF